MLDKNAILKNAKEKNKVYLKKLTVENKGEEFCPLCGKKGYKFGKTLQDVQRYRCKKCNKTYSLNQKTGQVTRELLLKAQEMYKNGKSKKEIALAINKTTVTVTNLIKKGFLTN